MTSVPPSPATPADERADLRVAIVGGGASGILTAINLLAADRDGRFTVTIHEASGILGRGIAYGTSDPRHLLNVRARHMSAFPDIPSDLLEWAVDTGRDLDPLGFLPRMEFSSYLQDRLARVADHRLTVRGGRVDDIERTATGFRIHSAGTVSEADRVVLAYGNQHPAPLTIDGVEVPVAAWHLADPWDLAAMHRLDPAATVVVVGTGLTAIDTAITLLEEHPERRVVMVSRHGLLPASHIAQQSTAWVVEPPEGEVTADSLVEFFTAQVDEAAENGVDWRAVVDGMRGPTQSLWQRLGLEERRRFLERYSRQWEIRRHRMAPEVGARIAGYQEAGRLQIRSGGVASIRDLGTHAAVGLGATETEPAVELAADAVINCTGPNTDVSRSADPLLAALRGRDLIAPDALRLGIDCTPEGELLDPSGRVVEGLFAIGTPRKGVLWETTAIPEIRAQAAEVAHRLAAEAAASEVLDGSQIGR